MYVSSYFSKNSKFDPTSKIQISFLKWKICHIKLRIINEIKKFNSNYHPNQPLDLGNAKII